MSMLKVYRAVARTCTLKAATASPLRAAMISSSTKFVAKKPSVITLKPMTSTLAVRKMSDGTNSMSKGPGAVPGAIPSSLEHGCGVEHEELVMRKEGLVRFDRRPLSGPFGTVDAPVPVPSALDARVVACTGGGPDQPEHPQLWFNVRKGYLNMCPQCGQIFEIVDPKPVKVSDVAAAEEH